MAILDCVTTANAATGIRAIISGTEGVGKTTLCCQAPRVLLVPLEIGYAGQTVHKVPMLEHYEHVMLLLYEIEEKCKAGTFPYSSIVVDSLTAMERLVHTAVLEKDKDYNKENGKAVTMETALGGYGKAYTFANELFEKFLKKCDTLAVAYGRNIIFTCHVFAARVSDPSAGEFDTWDLRLHSPKNQKTFGKREMLTEWADLIAFLHEPMYVSEAVKGQTMRQGISAKQGRMLAVARTPAYVAKNRFNLTEMISIPREHGWNILASAIYAGNGTNVYNYDVQAAQPAVAT